MVGRTRIQIIRSTVEETENQTGIGYYADYVEDLLTEMKIEHGSTYFKLTREDGFRSLIFDNMIYPSLNLRRVSDRTDIVHAIAEHCSLFFPFAKAKKVLTFHHVVKPGEAHKSWDIIWHISVFLAKHLTDKFIAISPQTKEDMINILNIPEDKITVITHPPKLTMLRKDIPKENRIGFIGSLCDRKRPELAVDVFAEMLKHEELEDYRLVICGDGPKRRQVEEHIRKRGLEDRVDIVSNLSEDEICDFYNRCRLLLNTSSLEGLGITTLESQRCGTPVLYFTDAEIPPEIMVAAVPCETVNDMGETALRILTDSEEMERLVELGTKCADSFGRDYKEKLMEVYNKVL